jgi:transcriptional regulator with XRE-family HTH domain
VNLLWDAELSTAAGSADWTEPAPVSQKTGPSLLGAAALVTTSIFGMGTCAPVTSPTQRPGLVGIEWTSLSVGRRVPAAARSMQTTGPFGLVHVVWQPREGRRDLGTAEQIRFLHEHSGLTWEQLGRLFGVSRRALHNWAGGSRLSAGNAETLARIVAALAERTTYSPEENRDWFLRARGESGSLFDEIRLARKHGEPIEEVLGVRERLGIA